MRNEIYEKNIEYLREFITDENLKSFEELDEENFVLERSVDGKAIIKAKYNDTYIYLNSRYDPEREAELMAEKIMNSLKKDTTLMMCGIGLGYVLKHIIKKLGEKKNKIVVIEPNAKIFNHLIRNIDCTDFFTNENIKFFISKDEEQTERFLSKYIKVYNFDNLHAYGSKAYCKVFNAELDFLREAIANELRQNTIRQNTLISFSRSWFENQIVNSKYVVDGYNADAFNGAFEGMPVVMVASGPSLDKNIELLKEIKNKVFILAAYSAIGALSLHNVIPDMVVSIDGMQPIFEDSDSPLYDVPLLCFTCSRSELLDSHRGKLVFAIIKGHFYRRFLSRFNREFISYEAGESVANIMLDFLVKTKADPIIIIGQDLAFTGGKVHVTGSTHIEDPIEAAEKNAHIIVEDVYGNQVPSSYQLHLYQTWFERYLDRNNGINVIDATEGGAKIKGTEVMTLRDAIDKYCTSLPSDIDTKVEELYSNALLFNEDEKKSLIDDFKAHWDALQSLLPILSDATKDSDKLEELYTKSDDPGRKKVIRILDRLKQVDTELGKHSYNMPILETAFNEVRINLKRLSFDDLSDGLRAAKMSKALYNGLKSTSEVAIPLLENAIAGLESGLEEGSEYGK